MVRLVIAKTHAAQVKENKRRQEARNTWRQPLSIIVRELLSLSLEFGVVNPYTLNSLLIPLLKSFNQTKEHRISI